MHTCVPAVFHKPFWECHTGDKIAHDYERTCFIFCRKPAKSVILKPDTSYLIPKTLTADLFLSPVWHSQKGLWKTTSNRALCAKSCGVERDESRHPYVSHCGDPQLSGNGLQKASSSLPRYWMFSVDLIPQNFSRYPKNPATGSFPITVKWAIKKRLPRWQYSNYLRH